MSLLRLGCRKGDQSWCTRRCRCIIPCTQTHSPHTTLIPPLLPDIYPASLNNTEHQFAPALSPVWHQRGFFWEELFILGFIRARRCADSEFARQTIWASQRDVFAGGWLLKKVMILFFLCLWLQSANLCQNPPKRLKMDKTQLDSFDIAKNANDWKRRGCRFSIHWQRGTVGNFSNRLIWKPRWSFCSIALYYISLLSGLGNIWWSKQKSKCEWQRSSSWATN